MKPIANWDKVKPAAERVQLPKGGYVVKILDSKLVEFPDKNDPSVVAFSKLELSIDITEGEYKDYYANDYRAQNMEDKRWKGVLRMYVPKDDGSEKDEWTKSSFKAMTDAVEESNAGYHWDWNEAGLKGKIVGCLFRSEEWDYNGSQGWATRPFKLIPANLIREGKYKVPPDKPLKNKPAAGNPLDVFVGTAADDDDLPF